MYKLSLASRKGGTGKTAVAVNLAAGLAERGVRVLLVDLDSQANASAWLGATETRGLAETFVDGKNLADAVVETRFGVDLIPSSGLWLAKAEKLLAGEPGAELIFRKAVEKLPERWDYLIFDTPPSAGLATVSALVASVEVIVPVESSAVSLRGISGLMQVLRPIRERLNPSLRVRVLMARLDRTKLGAEIVDTLAAKFGDRFLSARIRDRVCVREAWGHAEPVTVYDPDGDASADYRALCGAVQALQEGNALHASS